MLQRHCQSSAFASMLGSTLKSTGKFCPPQIIYILSFPNFRNSLMCTSSVALLVMLLVFTLAILLGQKFLITIVCRKYSKYQAVHILRSTGGKGVWQWILSLQYYVIFRSLLYDNQYQISHEISSFNTCFGSIFYLRLCKSSSFVNYLFVFHKILMDNMLLNPIGAHIGRGVWYANISPQSHQEGVWSRNPLICTT